MWIQRRTGESMSAFQLFVYGELSDEFDITEEVRGVLDELLGDYIDGNLSQQLLLLGCDRRDVHSCVG